MLPSPPVQRLLFTRQFADAIGISESSARRLVDSGAVVMHRTAGGHRKIPFVEAIHYARETQTTVARPDLLGMPKDPADLSPATSEAHLSMTRLMFGIEHSYSQLFEENHSFF